MENKTLPEGILLSHEDFIKDFKALCDKYGYRQYFVFTSEPIDEDNCDYKATWNTEFEGMVTSLEESVGILRAKVDKIIEDREDQ